MEIPELRDEQLKAFLQVMKAVMSNEGKDLLTESERNTMSALNKYVFQKEEIGCDLFSDKMPLDSLDVFDTEGSRLFVVQIAALMPFLDGNINQNKAEIVFRLANTLGIHFPMLDDLKLLVEGNVAKAKRRLMKRLVRTYYGKSLFQFSLRVLRQITWNTLFPNRMLIKKIKEYANRDKNLTGSYLYQYYSQHGFQFPGDRGLFGAKELMSHDMHHVLGNYKTNRHGEMDISAFEGGCCKHDAMDYLMVGLMQFNCGIKFDVPVFGKGGYDADTYWAAFAKGVRVNCDIMRQHKWDFWPLLDVPIEDARKALNIHD